MAQNRLTYSEFVNTLKDCDIQKGDVILFFSSLKQIGPLECGNDRKGILEFYYSALKDLIGEEGTLLVFTGFPDYGRYGTPFILEESPSRMGVFSEYVRTLPNSIRSMHPIVNVTGNGKLAKEICGGHHFEGQGYKSPWGKMHRRNAKIVSMGVYAFTIVHYIESIYGVPYKYVKIYKTPVYANGIEVPGPFTMTNRYLDYSIAYNHDKYKKYLIDLGLTKIRPIGRSCVYVTKIKPAFDVLIEKLNEDRYFFLEKTPVFRYGEYPADGLTGDSKYIYSKPGPNIIDSNLRNT